MADEPLLRLSEGRRLLDGGDLEGALRTLSPLTGHPDAAIAGEAWLAVGMAFYRLDDEPRALSAWEAAARGGGPSAWLGWRSVAEQRVRDGNLNGAIEAYGEAARRAPADGRGAIANRLGWLNKETGHDFQARRQFNRARAAYGSYLAIVTYAILGLTVATFLADAVLGGGLGGGLLGGALFGGGGPLVALGAVNGPDVANGEWYRIFTSAFLHLGPIHLLFNMYALYLFGPLVERMYGHVEFATVYLLAAAGGSVLTILVDPVPGAAGASGAIFGLFGLVFVVSRRHKIVARGEARALIGQVGGLLVFNLVFTFLVPGISWTGHIGGLLVGALLGFLLPPTGVSTLGSLWRTPGGQQLQTGVPVAVRAAAYAGVAAVLVVGGLYAVATA